MFLIGINSSNFNNFIFSFFDNKINTKDQLINKLNENLSVIGEIPHIPPNQSTNMLADNLSRTPLAESFRILPVANLDFVLFDNDNKSNQNVILVTSSIKGEGKTLISLNAAKLMSEKNKRVIVIGADLRNPQLHKLIGIKKTKLGLSDYISNTEIDWANN